MPGAEGGESGELVFNGYRVSVLQDENHSGDWLHHHVNVLNTTELHLTLKNN